MDTSPLTANSPEPTKKSFWRMEMPRWCKWFMFWLIVTAIPLCTAITYATKQKSPNVGYAILAVLLTANYMMSLTALVKSFVKEK
ncbi:MAG: hypothetical protein ACREE6_17755 [Limisphaerales bacterium]